MKIEGIFKVERSEIQEVESDFLRTHDVRLFVKRDDLIHEEVSGNKWRKLKYNVIRAIEEKREGILTFGGAYSNHLIATASACKTIGLKSIGIVRGKELDESSNETLKRCSELGMKLVFITREEYKLRNEKYYIESLALEYQNFLIVPEGGANYHGIIGCQEILKDISGMSDVFVSQGTSTTSVGLLTALKDNMRLHVVPALKGYESISEMRTLLRMSGFDEDFIEELLSLVIVHEEYHFGGYGKYTTQLLEFIKDYYRSTGIKLDPVYTGKVMFAIYDLVKRGAFNNRKILFVHTGGIQGCKSIEEKSGFSLFA